MATNSLISTEDGKNVLGKSLSVKVVQSTDMNKNTSWFHYPGVWTTYLLIIFIAWFLILSLFGCQPGTAWTVVHLLHSLVVEAERNRRCRIFEWKEWPDKREPG